MKNRRTLIEVETGRVNTDGLPVNKHGTPINKFKVTTDDKEFIQAVDKTTYYLLHWGIHSEMRIIDGGATVVLSYTVGICQDIKTGQISIFSPEQIRILGTEI